MINSQYQNRNNITNFTWIPFYKELANKLLEYQNNRIVLINKIKDIFSEMSHLELPTLERDNNIIDIDPFTVLGLFNKGITNNNRIELLLLFKKHFDLISEIPIDFSGVPVLNNQKSTFYYFLGDRKDNDIDNLWILFETAINYEKTQAQQIATEFNNIFNIVKDQQGVRWNITMGLFWIAPNIYINLDSKNRNAIQKAPFISDNLKKKLKLFGCNLPDGSSYLNFCQQLNRELQMNVHGINNFSEFSFYADRITNNDGNNEKPFDLKANTTINIPLNQILYGPPGTGKTYNTVVKAIEITKPELIQRDKNGNVKNYDELKIEFDKLRHQGQIEFVTFHQSYSYEEFVECIKPDIESGELKYKLEDGIFKNICEKASTLIIEDANNNAGLNSNPKIWKVSLMKTGENEIRKDCMKNSRIRIGFDKYGEDISDETVFDDGGSRVLSAFINKMEIGDIVLSCYSEKTIDAIGVITSEYKWDDNLPKYKRYREVKWLVKGLNYNILEINSGAKFTLGTVYQLNNISIKDVLDIVNQNNGKQSYKTNDQPHILIIDEINRGDVSKIFGELITLIEEDKRIGEKHQMTVTLPYSRETFGVPNNLYIIGTMNTADRSIALLDTALRRRFDFEEMMPKPELLRGKDIEGVVLEQLLTQINDRIKNEYDRDHQIGHSYLMEVENKKQLERAYKNRILPLLNEYFYNDIDAVAKILNCKPNDITSKENWFNVLKEAQKPTKKENEQ